MNNRGFLLADALINVFVVSLLCLLCFSLYRLMGNDEEIFEAYVERTNERYEMMNMKIETCVPCIAPTEDQ